MFGSANSAITDTVTAMTELAGIYVDAKTHLERFELEKLMEDENKRRTEAFELQKRLTEAQINLMEDRDVRLSEGDALISIDRAGLQPHQEAFMWEILEAIQVRVRNMESFF